MSLSGITEIVRDMSDEDRKAFCLSIMRDLDRQQASSWPLALAAIAAGVGAIIAVVFFA